MAEDPFIKRIYDDAAAIDKDTERMRAERLASREYRELHSPKPLGQVYDISFGPAGKPTGRRIIKRYDDGYGNIIHTAISDTLVSYDQIPALSAKIQGQQASFGKLEVQRQSELREEFNRSNGGAQSVKLYRDYLESESLGRRFDQLKQNSTLGLRPQSR